ncbi:unnamed protein product [Danaus chrysippus]|uniref:(African queen) hypothetical protein n=1 Tax=Danaus chrysippus TaxID=151541 RepID=A0A8J2RC05_9NEOP|nr:unnamed protein product [Danaus chrysippus]
MMKMLQQMLERLVAPQVTKVKIMDIFLPNFDPDGSIDISEWCQDISTAMNHYELKDYEVRMKVMSLL